MVSENETLNSGESKESDKPKSMPFDMKNEENGLNELDDRPTW